MKAEKRGEKVKDTRKSNTRCSICGIDMDCLKPKNGMLTCDRCMDMLENGYSPEELKMTPENISKHIPQCEKVAGRLLDLTFDENWKQVLKIGKENYDHEGLAKEFFRRGSVSMLLLMISLEMPPEFLDEMDEVLREAKKMRAGEGK